MNDNVYLSIVIPVYNEEENIPELLEKLDNTIKNLSYKTEVIFVDDGSTDKTFELLNKARDKYKWLGILKFTKNYGQQAAITAGFMHAKGKYLAMMDGDLQLDPDDIPKLVEKLEENYDIVLGIRKQRPESFFIRRLPSKFANFLFSKITGTKFKDLGCGMQAFKREFVTGLSPYTHIFNHSAIYAVWRRKKIAEVPVNFYPRKYGTSKYRWVNLVHLFLDIVISFSTKPIFLFITFMAGLFMSILSFLLFISGLIVLFYNQTTSLILILIALFTLITALLSFAIGFINERIARIYHFLENTPMFEKELFLEPKI